MPHALPWPLRVSSIFSSAGLHEVPVFGQSLIRICVEVPAFGQSLIRICVGTPIYTVDLYFVQAVDTPASGARTNLATAFLLLSM